MRLDGPEWSKMAQNGHEWMDVPEWPDWLDPNALNELKWHEWLQSETDGLNGFELIRMGEKGLKRGGLLVDGQRWSRMALKGPVYNRVDSNWP